MSLIEEHFPVFFRSADEYSTQWQRRYMTGEKLQYALLLLAAAVGSFSGPPALVVFLFALALVTQLYLLTSRAAEKWWNGRAGAESAKSAAWRYVVGGEPFGLKNKQSEADLANRMVELARDVAQIVPVPVDGAHVTAEMRTLRSRAIGERVSTYQRERIRSQQSWYAGKAAFNSNRATRWSLAGAGTSALALCFGLGAAIQGWSLDAVGLFSTVGASVAAWMALKQYQTLERSYAVASADLARVDLQIGTNACWAEAEWAAFVNEAEEAISREHVSWRTSRRVEG